MVTIIQIMHTLSIISVVLALVHMAIVAGDYK